MQHPNVNEFAHPLSKRHESRNEELRHERKTEDLRLDSLKKILQAKIRIVNSCQPNVAA
jgi:hypothetical protein